MGEPFAIEFGKGAAQTRPKDFSVVGTKCLLGPLSCSFTIAASSTTVNLQGELFLFFFAGVLE